MWFWSNLFITLYFVTCSDFVAIPPCPTLHQPFSSQLPSSIATSFPNTPTASHSGRSERGIYSFVLSYFGLSFGLISVCACSITTVSVTSSPSSLTVTISSVLSGISTSSNIGCPYI